MVIEAGGIRINLELKHLASFQNIEVFRTKKQPEYFLSTVEQLPSFSKKQQIEKTLYFIKYETELGILQEQYIASRWIGSILYAEEKAFLYLKYDCFEVEYLLSQYVFVAWIKKLKNNLFIHSSSVNYQNSGILFCAKSGVGKSTQRKLWEEFGQAVCINDDKNVLCITDGKITILPNPWSGKHFVSTNQSAPLKAIIFLKQGKTNKVIELSNEDAFPLLLSQIDLPKYEIKEEWGKLIDSLLELPLYLFECNMESEAFYTLEKQLRNRGVFNDIEKE